MGVFTTESEKLALAISRFQIAHTRSTPWSSAAAGARLLAEASPNGIGERGP
jgi:hypothetical protein